MRYIAHVAADVNTSSATNSNNFEGKPLDTENKPVNSTAPKKITRKQDAQGLWETSNVRYTEKINSSQILTGVTTEHINKAIKKLVIKPRDFAVLSHIVGIYNPNIVANIYISVPELARRSFMSLRSARYALKSLKQQGYIIAQERLKKTSNGKYRMTTCFYFLTKKVLCNYPIEANKFCRDPRQTVPSKKITLKNTNYSLSSSLLCKSSTVGLEEQFEEKIQEEDLKNSLIGSQEEKIPAVVERTPEIARGESSEWDEVFRLGAKSLKVPMPNAVKSQELIEKFKAKGDTCQSVQARIMKWAKSPHIVKNTNYLTRLLFDKDIDKVDRRNRFTLIEYHKKNIDIMSLREVEELNKTREEIFAWMGIDDKPVEVHPIYENPPEDHLEFEFREKEFLEFARGEGDEE